MSRVKRSSTCSLRVCSYAFPNTVPLASSRQLYPGWMEDPLEWQAFAFLPLDSSEMQQVPGRLHMYSPNPLKSSPSFAFRLQPFPCAMSCTSLWLQFSSPFYSLHKILLHCTYRQGWARNIPAVYLFSHSSPSVRSLYPAFQSNYTY